MIKGKVISIILIDLILIKKAHKSWFNLSKGSLRQGCLLKFFLRVHQIILLEVTFKESYHLNFMKRILIQNDSLKDEREVSLKLLQEKAANLLLTSSKLLSLFLVFRAKLPLKIVVQVQLMTRSDEGIFEIWILTS